MNITEKITRQRLFFGSGATREIGARIAVLHQLLTTINKYETEIKVALFADLHKSSIESELTEIGFVRKEINDLCQHLYKWAKPQSVATPWLLLPAKSYIRKEPYGIVLILAPWNYPFQLLLAPLAGAVAAGNCVLAKPSEQTPHTAAVLRKIIAEAFLPQWVACSENTVQEREDLLSVRYDYIFYTGGGAFGKEILRKAAEYLTPVTLELGGKSPCIVDQTADLSVAARRIVWGKFLNAGQTCVAPDYLWVEASVKELLIEYLKKEIVTQLGKEPQKSPFYGRIVNDRQWDRLENLLNETTICYGGERDKSSRYIAPTLVENITRDHPLMQQEIFGPILPIISFSSTNEIIHWGETSEHPLALYLFSSDKKAISVLLQSINSGGVAINDVVVQTANSRLPFGGVGASGMGDYHGRFSFDTFSHQRGMVQNRTFPDIPLRYPPYKKWMERLLGYL